MIAAYGYADYLRRTLTGLARQSFSDFEVIICDDGSGPEIAGLAREYSDRLNCGVIHVYQENKGFRKCRILNLGVIESKSDYLIFLDADCIPHRHFVREHIRERKRGRFLVGRRVELGDILTERLTEDVVKSGRYEQCSFRMMLCALQGKGRHLESAFYVPHWARIAYDGGRTSLLGCNFSCWKDVLYQINGFDEAFVTASGGEDTDVERRFRLCGLLSKSVKHCAICYHQYHKSVDGREDSLQLLTELAAKGEAECEKGLNQYDKRR